MAKKETNFQSIAQNKRAKFDYEFVETLEAGIALQGTELKSIRAGYVSINEAHAGESLGELYLFNASIKEYEKANQAFNHEAKRPRKLLLHKKQLNKWLGAIRKKGLTIVPVYMYFNHKGLVKLHIALARGKKLHDKRETIKQRDWARDKSRILKNQ